MINEISQNSEAFVNRYALLIPSNVNLSRITQLQHELGAVSPLLTKNVAGVIYLTADKFLNIHFLVEKAKSLGRFDKFNIDDVKSEVFYIDHWFFEDVYFEYPKKELEQGKRVINNLPFYLGDCLIVREVDYSSRHNIEFKIYRIELSLENEIRYLDLITNINQDFLAVGSNVWSKDSGFDVSKNVCDTLALSMIMRDSF